LDSILIHLPVCYSLKFMPSQNSCAKNLITNGMVLGGALGDD
jgi:hypothetical protein